MVKNDVSYENKDEVSRKTKQKYSECGKVKGIGDALSAADGKGIP